jgi:tetratricopeptide (TPR) repeat protein
MRSVETLVRAWALGAMTAAVSGCALLTGPPMPPPAPAPAAAPAATKPAAAAKQEPAPATATTAATPAAPAAAAPPQPPAEPPLDPAVVRAFAQARQALAAGRLEQAEREFKALAQAHPELGGAHANLGLVYRRMDKLAESVAALERAVQANPKQPVYFNQLGIAYRMVGRFADARAAYEKAISLDASYAPAHLNLGVLYDLYLWDGARALELYERYLALTPAGDDKVKRWVAELRKREPGKKLASRKERE